MNKPNPIALTSQHPKPCFVCDTPTRRIRSGTHLNGSPTDPKDFFRICLACDADWSSAIFEEIRHQKTQDDKTQDPRP
jgi:hypothetical protein